MYDNPRSTSITNFVLYQLGWFAVVLGAAWNHVLLGSALGAGAIGVHWLLVAKYDRVQLRSELLKALAFLGLGVVLEGGNALLGIYAGVHGRLGSFSPWLLVLWPGFAASFYGSLRWLHGRWALAAALGAPLGPIAYFAGSRLGAITMTHEVDRVALLAAEWGIALPVMAGLSKRFSHVE